MWVRNYFVQRLRFVFPALLIWISIPAYSQARKTVSAQRRDQTDHTIRVNVALVQTDVMVFDRQGHFVPDLKVDQFELKVDNKAQPVSFMEVSVK